MNKDNVNEEAPSNSAGGGQVAGIGVGPSGEPGGQKARLLKMWKRYLEKKQ